MGEDTKKTENETEPENLTKCKKIMKRIVTCFKYLISLLK